jgi:hypothetical protein
LDNSCDDCEQKTSLGTTGEVRLEARIEVCLQACAKIRLETGH